MKIIATVRTKNEEKHIRQYCESYSEFADAILIADGGSVDNTIRIALEYPKVEVKDYPVTVTLADGSIRNPDGPHVQFLVDWATEIGGDWIVHQDCDQRPNKFLKQDIRDILSVADYDYLQVTQIYLWGKEQYFPNLSFMGGAWQQGLWAWRLSTGLKILDCMPHYWFSLNGKEPTDINKLDRNKVKNILPPYCFMHFGWQTEDETMKHVQYYRQTKLIPDMAHPLGFGGKPEPLLDWMIE